MPKPVRLKMAEKIRKKLQSGKVSLGTWMQIPHASIAEIMGSAGYDWVAVDLEHGSVCLHQLPDIFRALELGGSLPLARIAEGNFKDCKQALDAGAGGVIVPMIEDVAQLRSVRDACCWPPAGKRGVGFSRANMFGENFRQYAKEARKPFLVAQLEHIRAIDNLEDILRVKGIDAVFIGPYDLSASMGLTAQFEHPKFNSAIKRIIFLCRKWRIACGIHVVHPYPKELAKRIKQGYRFIAYSIDAVFLNYSCKLAKKP